MDVLRLNEDQNAAFDQDYHTPQEFAEKVECVRNILGRDPVNILDIGGGNGRFLDALLAEYPNARGVNLDISKGLLEMNTPHARKRLVHCAFEDFKTTEKFDLITVNWVLHHLVGTSYQACGQNCLDALARFQSLLTPDGVNVVAENLFEGVGDASGRIVYEITRVQNPVFIRLARRYFNTAGVGVCFRSRRGWMSLFDSDFVCRKILLGPQWDTEAPWTYRLMLRTLLLTERRHGHFYLTSRNADALAELNDDQRHAPGEPFDAWRQPAAVGEAAAALQ